MTNEWKFQSIANPSVVIVWHGWERPPEPESPCWGVYFDTPDYSHYEKYVEHAHKRRGFTKQELEDFIAANLLPTE